MLSDSDSDAEADNQQDVHQLTINEHYAKAFEYKKEREELQRRASNMARDPDSEEDESTDSEDLESEDSDGEELTPAMDAAILRTLARIRAKDPEIYTEGKDIFGEQEKTTKSASALTRPAGPGKEPKDKGKPLTMRAANLQNALRSPSPEAEPAVITHAEEQRRLRDETIAAFHAAEGDEEEDFLVAREEEEYRRFLENEVGDLRELVDVGGSTTVAVEEPAQEEEEEEGAKKKKKKDKKKKKEGGEEGSDEAAGAGKNKQEEDQEFLVNYILNRGWIDRSSKRVPTYGEVTSHKKAQPADDSGSESGADAGADDTDEEEVFDDIVDRFESSYNFRFEEADGSEIKTYPRNLPSLVRREDTTRKDARERRKQRKEEELAKRKEEVAGSRGSRSRRFAPGSKKLASPQGKQNARARHRPGRPWDPEAHDKQMANLYLLNGGDGAEAEDEYGDNGEFGFEEDRERPTWDNDVDIGDIRMSPEASTSRSDKKKEKKKKKKGADEDDAGVDVDAMDADAVPAGGDDDEEWDGTEEMRKRKLDEWMDEAGGLPTRFHYTSVAPQSSGYSELNEYMSVKKYAPYRADNKAGWDNTRNDRLRELKGKVKERMGGIDVVERGGGAMGKKERMKEKGLEGAAEEANGAEMKATSASEIREMLQTRTNR
ncbi:hypothetical protein B0H14DRAFT_2871859 [Mycena olivaceomarginata]|nr:hypothetical protein B0H14DRAFT_2871859 [Mycena olivaceomarginata]